MAVSVNIGPLWWVSMEEEPQLFGVYTRARESEYIDQSGLLS